MTSKERVRAALEGRIPDRVPYAEFAVDFDTVERLLGHETFLRAKARSQIAFWEGRYDEVAQSLLGFDAYQSIQPTAGMDICRLKKDYGGRITLWGGVAVGTKYDNYMALLDEHSKLCQY